MRKAFFFLFWFCFLFVGSTASMILYKGGENAILASRGIAHQEIADRAAVRAVELAAFEVGQDYAVYFFFGAIAIAGFGSILEVLPGTRPKKTRKKVADF